GAVLHVAGVTYTVDGVATGAGGTDLPAGVTLTGDSLSVDPTDPAYDHLAVGEQAVIKVSYNVTDEHGAVVAQTETVTITGANDPGPAAPTPKPAPSTAPNDAPVVPPPLPISADDATPTNTPPLPPPAAPPTPGAALQGAGAPSPVDGAPTGAGGTDRPAGVT